MHGFVYISSSRCRWHPQHLLIARFNVLVILRPSFAMDEYTNLNGDTLTLLVYEGFGRRKLTALRFLEIETNILRCHSLRGGSFKQGRFIFSHQDSNIYKIYARRSSVELSTKWSDRYLHYL